MAILALAERLPAFGPTTRPAHEIAARERRALAEALAHLELETHDKNLW